MTLTQIQQSCEDYKVAFEAGQISRDEYIDLMKGLEIEEAVAQTAEELEFKTQLNTYINAAISAASLVA